MDLLQGPLRAKGPAHTRGFLGSKEVLWQEEIPLLESCKNLSESHKRLLKLTLCISSECLHLEQNSEIRRKSQIITIFLRPILCEAGTFTSISRRCSQNTPQTPESYYPHCSGFSKQSTLWQSHQPFPTKAHLSLQHHSRNSPWLGSWNKVFWFCWHFEPRFIGAIYFCSYKRAQQYFTLVLRFTISAQYSCLPWACISL